MEELDRIAEAQDAAGQEVYQQYSNFKKDPKVRKESTQYFLKRIETLEGIFSKFVQGNEEFTQVANEANVTDHPYLTKRYFNKVREMYDQYKEALQSGYNEIRNQEASNGSEHETRHNEHSGEHNKESKEMKLLKVNVSALGRILATVEQDLETVKSKEYYEQKLQSIENYWTKISKLHQEIMVQDTSENYTTETYEVAEDQYMDVATILRERININSGPNSKEYQSTLKLPKISIPTFSGDGKEWKQFEDLFQQLVHKQPFSTIEKFYRLKSTLAGEASSLIRHLPVTSENYETAWKTLMLRYDNKRVITSTQINGLLTQSRLFTESSKGLKQLHDCTKECLSALKNMGINISTWDPIILEILLPKLDRETRKLYEQGLENPRELQTIDHLLDFVQRRFQALETCGVKLVPAGNMTNKAARQSSVLMAQNRGQCAFCSSNHQIYNCDNFLNQNAKERLEFLKRKKLCINCMRYGHFSALCKTRNCIKCSSKHNTLVHDAFQSFTLETIPQQDPYNGNNESEDQVTSLSATTIPPQMQPVCVFLATIRLNVLDKDGKLIECRAVLDSGSQLNFITEEFATKLSLKNSKSNMEILGIGSAQQRSSKRMGITISSNTTGYSANLDVYLLKKICENIPSISMNVSSWPIPKNIKLADPNFNKTDKIDLLLGAELYSYFLSIGQIKLNDDLPTLQNTVFGWVFIGRVNNATSTTAFCGISNIDIERNIDRLWELEKVETNAQPLTDAERRCEQFFSDSTTRDSTGRFIVKLPFRNQTVNLGTSKAKAIQRFEALEKRLSKTPDIKQQYVDFMDEYKNLGHMEPIAESEINDHHYFIPHHCVLKPESSTTKLRVVFDASAKTSNNISLNDTLLKGAKLQTDLFEILLRFRMHKYVFIGDIAKMYRQIMMHENDQHFQLIVWRSRIEEPLGFYKLKTVTYGTTSAPYAAMKCLKTLAEAEKENFPYGATVALSDFFVDDVMSGSNCLKKTLLMQEELIKVLKAGGFHIRKWCANHVKLLESVPKEDIELELNLRDDREEQTKTLGITWVPKSDLFVMKTVWTERKRFTKRTILADTAHLFDPMGVVSPVIVKAKLIFRETCLLKLDWDAALPQHLHTIWSMYREGLKELNKIKIPRRVCKGSTKSAIQLHGFADASEKAYGAVFYVKSVDIHGNCFVQLLASKSRVAPLKVTTIPRLELCAAKLLSQLGVKIQNALEISSEKVFYWTDSEIVLAWLNAESSSYKTFVANRISSIQQQTESKQWGHVRSAENPADLISRGMSPQELVDCKFWFEGPEFLKQHVARVREINVLTTSEESKIQRLSLIGNVTEHMLNNINHRNSFRTLQNIVAYILRFTANARLQKARRTVTNNLSVAEKEKALLFIIKQMQQESFQEEVSELKQMKQIKNGSALISLNPFLDEKTVLRVGGRLEAATINYDAKHPMILPNKHPFTVLLITHLHIQHLHAGPQALLAYVRQRFWPLRGKCLTRSVFHNCVLCRRARPKLMSQIMGNLPVERIQPSRPFVNVGCDFCGPVQIHYKLRGKRPTKSYIAVFVCFATKAIHLEAVSDLTTDGFIGALKRFISRRGKPAKIFSDNATNFMGAKTKLEELQKVMFEGSEKLTEECLRNGTEWLPIPPRSPHFGGLWEAAVKSAKSHLVKIMKDKPLTFEELTTVLSQIEAILNSRPLTPLPANSSDAQALTPGHFLIGEPLTTIPDVDAKERNIGMLQRWSLVTALHKEFWRKWSRDYLCELQQRYKWQVNSKNIEVGEIVIIKEDNSAPLKWPLGRVLTTYFGEDGKTRVVELKTSSGIMKRPIHRLCPLPVENSSRTICDYENVLTKERERIAKETKMKRNGKRRIAPVTWSNNVVPKAPRTDKVNTPRTNAISLLCLVTLILPIYAAPVEVLTFNKSTAIYFENLGPTEIITDDWNVVVYYQLSPYFEEYKGIKEWTNALQTICKNLTGYEQECRSTMTHFMHQLEILETNEEIIFPNTKRYGQHKQKRSPFDFVGYVANQLFGVLDQNYAKEVEQMIKGVEGNQNYIYTILKNQTSLLDSTANILKKNLLNIKQQFDDISSHMQGLEMEIMKKGKTEHMSILFNAVALQLSMLMNNFMRVQTAIIEVLADVHHGKIPPLLITPEQLKGEIQRIKNHLPKNTNFPGQTDHSELIKLYSLMKAQATITQTYIIIKINIPLLSDEMYELHKLIPIPIPHLNAMMIIDNPPKYLAVNFRKDTYFILSTEEINMCTPYGTNARLCPIKYPTFSEKSNEHQCEWLAFQNRGNVSHCKYKTISTSHWFSQLQDKNRWLFSIQGQFMIDVVCNSSLNQVTLEKQGVIQLASNCILRYLHSTIKTSQKEISTVQLSSIWTPKSNLQTHQSAIQPHDFHIKVFNNSENINELKTLMDSIHDHQNNLIRHTIHNYATGYTAIGLIGLTIICAIILYVTKTKCNTRSHSIATTIASRHPAKARHTSMFELRQV